MPDPPRRPATTAVTDADPAPFAIFSSASGKDAAWIRATGELDLVTARQLKRALDDARTTLVVLDLHDVRFMDASGVHVVVDASAAARAAGRRLLVLRGPRRLRDVFDLTGTSDAIDSYRGGSAA